MKLPPHATTCGCGFRASSHDADHLMRQYESHLPQCPAMARALAEERRRPGIHNGRVAPENVFLIFVVVAVALWILALAVTR